MKKILGIMLIGLFLVYGNAFGAAGTCTDNFANGTYPSQNNGKSFQVIFTWVGSTDDGTVAATASSGPLNAYITKVVTNPSSSCTDDYDITLTDSDGQDVMGGKLGDRDTTTTEEARAYNAASGTYGDTFVKGTITLTISNNTDTSSGGTVTIYCERP